MQSKADQELTGKWLGEAQWLSQTTHQVILPALSILSSIKTTAGTLHALKHLFRYLKGKQDYALVNEIGNREGFVVTSDADWAGLFDLSGGQEPRSRTGVQITYDGMQITCKSYFQKCSSTNYKPGMNYTAEHIATSSADSELHAAKDALSEALHLRVVAEELEIPLSEKIIIGVDAGAALGFITNTSTCSSNLKHINLRLAWVQQIRDRSLVEFVKIPGVDNPSDLFTKVQGLQVFKEMEAKLMKKL